MIKIINTSSDAYTIGSVTIAAGATTTLSVTDIFELFGSQTFIDNIANANFVVEDNGTQVAYPGCLETFKWAVRYTPQATGTTRKSFSATTTQTNATVWTPASGKRIVLTGYQFTIHNNTLGTQTAQLFEDTNTAANIIYHNMTASGANYDVSHSLNPVIPLGIDKSIKATTSGAIRVAGVLFGFEV